MADIPPIHASAVQAGFQSRESTRTRDAGRNEQSHAANLQLKSVSDAAGMVDTTDADNQVFVDSEGAGSQGRDFADSGDAAPTDESTDVAAARGITQDGAGRLHLDLDA